MKIAAMENEQRIVYSFVFLSIIVHLIFFGIDFSRFVSIPKMTLEDVAMDVDLGIDSVVSKDITVPNLSEVNPQPAVPNTMLPQLPKKVQIEDVKDKTEDEGIGDQLDLTAKKKEDDKKKTEVEIKKQQEEQNKIKLDDALKRLALENLRKQETTSKPDKAQLSALNKLKEQIKTGTPGSVSGMGKNHDPYRSQLEKAIRRGYSLPDAYNLKDANLRVVIAIRVDREGRASAEIKTPSTDRVFDELALNVVKQASIPKPPPERIGEVFYLQFSPQTM